jgi:hypothetical protein
MGYEDTDQKSRYPPRAYKDYDLVSSEKMLADGYPI